ncbi:hypothetical protein ACJRO7_023044 [Eucalyptus globulus]|uniref:PGG domain-containing protein n=1 Tax=Eucalyptus globulus TaxID=34317 RepID=A0ABD3K117_EUCGL
MRSAIREKEQEMKMKEDGKPSPKYMDPSMYKAAKEGNFTALENSIRKYGEDEPRLDLLKLETRKGNSLVHLAAESGHEDFIKQVLRKCPQLVAKPNNSCRECAQLFDKPDKSCCGADTPLHIAARTRPFKVMETILSEAKLREGKATTETPCTQKMKEMENGGTARIITSLLSKTNGAGNTALHEALRNGDEKMGMLLWSEDEEMVGSVNKAGESALYVAAELGIEKVVKEMVKFLESGRQREESVRDRALRGPEGQNPLHAAVLAGSRMKALLKAMPELIKEADKHGRTSLDYVAFSGYHNLVRQLLELDISSICSGHPKVIKEIIWQYLDVGELVEVKGQYILYARVDQTTRNIKGETAFDIDDLTKETRVISSVTMVNWRQLGLPHHWNFQGGFLPSTNEQKSAASLMIATLITTVAFAAAFTLPGGYNNNAFPGQGVALLRSSRHLKWFIISDTNAMTCSIMRPYVNYYVIMAVLTCVVLQSTAISFEMGLAAVLPDDTYVRTIQSKLRWFACLESRIEMSLTVKI